VSFNSQYVAVDERKYDTTTDTVKTQEKNPDQLYDYIWLYNVDKDSSKKLFRQPYSHENRLVKLLWSSDDAYMGAFFMNEAIVMNMTNYKLLSPISGHNFSWLTNRKLLFDNTNESHLSNITIVDIENGLAQIFLPNASSPVILLESN
jgi:hypothetical protein